ncbi:siderophore ABC transporter substrate-binding protein [Janthinobacterium sp. SUN118]|uniref:siderophore ABC transporter substrate-binding protein n=1 Tax=Janthinobacterium sp. SUN118 TaxID=3004100 RepID=UPI0025B0B1A5|nr:siderophore ABC transporter substrate-binding protein [Janthinobacterium sp. SUN118]MDN2711046.1 siderophore ABC transporter substrate-binding protein [Janthinobacterium sp. SUN118]
MIWNQPFCALAVLIAAVAALQGCADKTASTPPAPAASASQQAFTPITIEHKLGATVIPHRPQRVAVLDMNEVDFLDQLGVPVAGMVKDYVPHFLTRYKDDAGIRDLGAIVQPNLEHLHALQPDLVLMTSIQANHYKELSQIAPTLHFDVDFQNSQGKHIDVVKEHLLTLGRIFGKEDVARQKAAELDAKVAAVRQVTQERPEKALIVMHNNGAFSAFGVQSRYGFVFDALGVKPASTAVEAGLHGQPISSEFIQQANPDILYVVDRTAVMERRPVMTAEQMANPLLRQTNAWKNGRVVFVDADAWYITAASVTSLKLLIDDVLKGYQ